MFLKRAMLIAVLIAPQVNAVELLRNTDDLSPSKIEVKGRVYPKQECRVESDVVKLGLIKANDVYSRDIPVRIRCTGYGMYDVSFFHKNKDNRLKAEFVSTDGLSLAKGSKCKKGANVFDERKGCVFEGRSDGNLRTVVVRLDVKPSSEDAKKDIEFNIPITIRTKV